MNNKLGIRFQDKGFDDLSAEEIISAIAAAGFETSFFAWHEKTDCFGMKKLYDKYNLLVDSIHAPYDGINCIWKNGQKGDDYVARLSKCIDDVSEMGVPYVVFHAICGEYFTPTSLIGIQRFQRLVDRACSKNVKICFENVEFSENLCFVMHEFGDSVGFCYDVGHEATNDTGIRFLKLFGDRLCVTHIHDNYGVSHNIHPTYHSDCHMIPLDASIDFKRVMGDIRECGYKGSLTLECVRHPLLKTYTNISLNKYLERAYLALKEISKY